MGTQRAYSVVWLMAIGVKTWIGSRPDPPVYCIRRWSLRRKRWLVLDLLPGSEALVELGASISASEIE